jgi:hypothetical protein
MIRSTKSTRYRSGAKKAARLKLRMALTAGVAVSLGGFTAAATVASFTAETTNPTNKFATGTLVLSNKVNSGTACLSTGGGNTDTNANAACDNLFSLTAQKPGDTSSANLTLQNVGSIAASALKLFSSACVDSDATGQSYHGTGSPCGSVQLTVQQWSDSGFSTPVACLYGGTTVANTCDFSDATKTMGAYATAHTGSANAQTIGSGLAANGIGYFTVAVKMASTAGNSLQGRQAAMDLTWHLDQ